MPPDPRWHLTGAVSRATFTGLAPDPADRPCLAASRPDSRDALSTHTGPLTRWAGPPYGMPRRLIHPHPIFVRSRASSRCHTRDYATGLSGPAGAPSSLNSDTRGDYEARQDYPQEPGYRYAGTGHSSPRLRHRDHVRWAFLLTQAMLRDHALAPPCKLWRGRTWTGITLSRSSSITRVWPGPLSRLMRAVSPSAR